MWKIAARLGESFRRRLETEAFRQVSLFLRKVPRFLWGRILCVLKKRENRNPNL